MTPTRTKFIALAVIILLCSTALIVVYVKWDKIAGGDEVVETGGDSSAAATRGAGADGVALAEGGGQPEGPSPKMKQVLSKHHLFKANSSEFTKRIAKLKASNPGETVCVICLCQDVDGSADMIETSCCSDSFYCVPCLERYLKDKYTCPVCRKSLTS